MEKLEKHFAAHAFRSVGIPSKADTQTLLKSITLGSASGHFQMPSRYTPHQETFLECIVHPATCRPLVWEPEPLDSGPIMQWLWATSLFKPQPLIYAALLTIKVASNEIIHVKCLCQLIITCKLQVSFPLSLSSQNQLIQLRPTDMAATSQACLGE